MKDNRIQIRLSPDIWVEIEKEVKKRGITKSEVIQRILIRDLIDKKEEENAEYAHKGMYQEAEESKVNIDTTVESDTSDNSSGSLDIKCFTAE